MLNAFLSEREINIRNKNGFATGKYYVENVIVYLRDRTLLDLDVISSLYIIKYLLPLNNKTRYYESKYCKPC